MSSSFWILSASFGMVFNSFGNIEEFASTDSITVLSISSGLVSDLFLNANSKRRIV